MLAGEVLAVASFLLVQAILTSHHGGLAGPAGSAHLRARGPLRPGRRCSASDWARRPAHGGRMAALLAILYLPSPSWRCSRPPWSQRVERFTLPTAAYQLIALHPSHGYFTPAISLLIVLAWPAVVLTVAAVLVTRRAA